MIDRFTVDSQLLCALKFKILIAELGRHRVANSRRSLPHGCRCESRIHDDDNKPWLHAVSVWGNTTEADVDEAITVSCGAAEL